MTPRDDGPFFIGFLPVPKGLKLFLAVVAVGLLATFAGMGLLVGATQDDPGDASFRFDWGRQTVTGVLEARPYPILHITEGTQRLPAGRTIMLAGQGKRGVQQRAERLEGQVVTASGVALTRGDLNTLQLRGGRNGLSAAGKAAAPTERENLGRWRLTGEICDGKCLTGAMRPGRGLSHRACANLCLSGGLAPVFVSTAPVAGQEFFLMGDSDGGPLTDDLLDHVAQYVELDGTVERRGSLLVFKVDIASLKVLP